MRAGRARQALQVDRGSDLRELRERFAAFRRRDLYDIQLAALFLDAIFLAVRRDGPKEGVLVAWGFTEDGERVLVSVMLGMRESHEDWLALARDLIAPRARGADADRGRRRARADQGRSSSAGPPQIASTAPFTASATCSPSCPNASANASAGPTGRRSMRPPTSATASSDSQALVDELDRAGYTAAARCLADDLDALVVHLRYPTRHRRRWRSTNLLERSLGEVKRRTKVIGRFPGETSCLTLVWAVLDLYISHATNGIKFTQLERQHLKRLRYEGHRRRPPRR